MAKRTTEAVLRAEIKVAEAAVEKAGGLVSSAWDTVKAATARLADADKSREEAKRRVTRAEAALAAYLPTSIFSVSEDVTRDLTRENVEDGSVALPGDRIHEPDGTVTVLTAGELTGDPAADDQAEAVSPKRKR